MHTMTVLGGSAMRRRWLSTGCRREVKVRGVLREHGAGPTRSCCACCHCRHRCETACDRVGGGPAPLPGEAGPPYAQVPPGMGIEKPLRDSARPLSLPPCASPDSLDSAERRHFTEVKVMQQGGATREPPLGTV
jgi:hypothetical protein